MLSQECILNVASHELSILRWVNLVSLRRAMNRSDQDVETQPKPICDRQC